MSQDTFLHLSHFQIISNHVNEYILSNSDRTLELIETGAVMKSRNYIPKEKKVYVTHFMIDVRKCSKDNNCFVLAITSYDKNEKDKAARVEVDFKAGTFKLYAYNKKIKTFNFQFDFSQVALISVKVNRNSGEVTVKINN